MELPREPPKEAVRQSDGSYVLELDDGSTARWSRRPDGTWRKPERKRAGWVGELEQKKYQPPGGREKAAAAPPSSGEREPVRIPGLPPGAAEEALAPGFQGGSANANRNERKKELRREKAEAKEAERAANAPTLVQAQAASAAAAEAPPPKAANPKAIEKKLRQIEELEQKRADGTELNADQLAKVEAKDSLLAELARLKLSDEANIEVPVPQVRNSPDQLATSAEVVRPAPVVVDAAPAQAIASPPATVVDQAAPEGANVAQKPANRKALEKKLRQIGELEEKQARGEALNSEQLEKLNSKAHVQAELRACA